jgi:hypothetical protein
MKDKECSVPKSTEQTLSDRETVDSAPQHGNVISAQPTVDAGEVKPGRWVGNGPSLKYIESK